MALGSIPRVSVAVTGLIVSSPKSGGTSLPVAGSDKPKDAQPASPLMSGRTGLLVPSTAAGLLKLMDEAPAATDSTKAFSPRAWLAQAMKSSAAKTDNLVGPGNSNYFTQQDLDVIRAATGYNLVVLEHGTAVVDDDGNPPASEEVARQVSHLGASISCGRAAGLFTGEATPEYLHDVFARFEAAKEPLPSDWLDKMIGYLQDKQNETPIETQAAAVMTAAR